MEAQAPGELAMLAQRPLRILVVDDNIQEQQLLKMKLEVLGTSLIQVRQGRLGIMMAQKSDPDIVILDLGTLDMPGLEVLRHLKAVKRTSAIPVICLSSSQDESQRLRALRLNADWYLHKPFRFSEMLARLRYHAQEIAAQGALQYRDMSVDGVRKNLMRISVDSLSDLQDIRKALHSLKGYVGADDYYLNNKLETCFRSIMRIESRLKESRDWSASRSKPAGTASPALGAPRPVRPATYDLDETQPLPPERSSEGTQGSSAQPS